MAVVGIFETPSTMKTSSSALGNKINFIQEYWGLNGPAFDNVPNPLVFYPSAIHQEALVRLSYAIEGGKGAALLTGDIGSGKTTLSRILIRNLPSADYEVALLNNPNFSRIGFLRELNYQLGIENSSSNRMELLHELNEQLLKNFEEGKNTVIVIDEAQVIKDITVFEEFRLLLNFQLNDRFLLTLVVLGQPDLRELISQIPQLEQRMAIKYHLGSLDIADTEGYITHRVKECNSQVDIFPEATMELIYKHTDGIPRQINNLCDLCLLSGYLAKVKTIDSAIVEQIIADGVY